MLLSGAAADRFAATLADQPTLSLIGPGEGVSLMPASFADVAVHVIASPHSPELAAEIAKLRERTNAPLILAAYGEPNGIVETGLTVGAADVLALPQAKETLLFALHKAARTNGAAHSGKILTVFSPKGGSGKTVLATNIAVAAARSGVESLLVDLDLQFGDAALTTGVSPRATIADLAGASGQMDVEKLTAFVSPGPTDGLSVLAAPTRPEEAQSLGQPELKAILHVAREAYGAVVVDTGPLFDAAVLAAVDCSDHLLIVSNPEITSLKNVRIGLETLDRLGFPRERISVVVNRVGAPGSVGRREIEQALDTEIGYELPDDAAVPGALNRAVPVVLADADSRFARAVSVLGTSLVGDAGDGEPATDNQRRFLLRGRR
ncbi:MAG TPA: AAA family ATPase [Gaiellaceae bacterium]|nr:AAA family ATPase [Gaiellaceae bacterium]